MKPRALLEIGEGEVPYKMAISDWMRDEDGAVIFRVISKKRKDGKIEFICYTQRSDGLKRIIQHINFEEKDFWSIMGALKESLKQFFPKIKFDVQNVNIEGGDGYRAMPVSRFNIFKLWLNNWLICKIESVKTLFKKDDKNEDEQR